MIPAYHAQFDYWEDQFKVTFDGVNKLIYINAGEYSIDVKEDIYSPWKRWVAIDNNIKFTRAMRSVGGEETPSGYSGDYYFLMNGWRIKSRPENKNATIYINGVLYTDEKESPVLPQDAVSVEWTVSNLLVGARIENAVPQAVLDQLDRIEATTNSVWDECQGNTMLLNEILSESRLARQFQSNKIIAVEDLNGDYLLDIYADDGTTVVAKMKVSKDGLQRLVI